MTTATAPERAAVAGLPVEAAPRHAAGRPGTEPGRGDERRTGPERPRGSRRTRRAATIAASIVLLSLLAVVGANAYLTQGQVRLTNLQSQLGSASGTYRDLELRLGQLENPSQVVSRASSDGLSPPSRVTDLTPVTDPASGATATSPANATPTGR